jgi:hypothetical protein
MHWKAAVVEFNLQKSIDFVLDEQHSAKLRAIEFFAFLVALHLGRPLKNVTGRGSAEDNTSSLVVEIPRKLIRAARVLSAQTFLDCIEQDWAARTGKNAKPLIRDMIEIPEYEEIHNRVISENGGWHKLRFLDSVRDVESDLAGWKRQARDVVRIIEFSFRFEPNPRRPKHLGGVTMATDIVTSVPYFKVKVKDSQLEKSWSCLSSTAPFLYLIYVEKYPFYLKKIAGTRFAERFLAMVLDRQRLLEFFARYNFLVERLLGRGYRYSVVKLPAGTLQSVVHRDPFNIKRPGERQVVRAIERYRK